MNRISRLIRASYQFFLLVFLFLFCQTFQSLFVQQISKPSKPFENYNIVFVFIDNLRADHLSCYGYPRKTSPNIDRLAKESIVFEQNLTPVTYTLPSFMSIITSIYPNSHGVLYVYKDKLSPRVTTLAQILKAYGYKTAWFGPLSDLQLKPEVGFGWGFDELAESEHFFRLDESRRNLCDWFDRNKDQRFFLNFHTYKVHAPYLPSPKYKARFTKIKSMEGVIEDGNELEYGSVYQTMKNKKLAIELMGEDFFNQFNAAGLTNGDNQQIEDFFASRKKFDKLVEIRNLVYGVRSNFQDKSVNAYVQTLYDAAILEYDEEVIGPVIAKLKALNIYDKTIIIICADHGEEFNEHGGGFSHGATLYDETTHVPLIIRVPWIKQAKRIKEFTQTVDIMPTLLDLLEIPIPHQAQGKSLVGLINNKKKSSPLHEYVFGSMDPLSYIRSKEWLFVFNNDDNPNQKELYNLCSDPGQQNNLYLKNKDIALKLESRFKEWEVFLPSYKDQEYSFPPEIDKATQERIRKTGYW